VNGKAYSAKSIIGNLENFLPRLYLSGGGRAVFTAPSVPFPGDQTHVHVRDQDRVVAADAIGTVSTSVETLKSATAAVTSNKPSTDAIACRTCERSHRSRIPIQSPTGAAVPVSKKRVAVRESLVFCIQYLFICTATNATSAPAINQEDECGDDAGRLRNPAEREAGIVDGLNMRY
jgi:hypothetical protein